MNRKKQSVALGLCACLLGGCSGEGFQVRQLLAGRESVVFEQSLYLPEYEFEKVRCDVEEGCYQVNTEMEAGLLIGNLIDSGVRKAAIVSEQDLDLDKVFMYALTISPVTFEAQYSQRQQITGIRRTVFTLTVQDEQELQRSRSHARRVVSEVIDPAMEDWQKVQALHEWVVLNTAYDQQAPVLTMAQRKKNISFRAAGVFERGMATCSGYMEAMHLLLNEAGVASLKVFSNTMDHAWNLVNVGGQMRYVDATFDDPVPDEPGRVLTDSLLLSPAQLHQLGKYEFDASTSTTLSEAELEAYFEFLF